MRLVHLADLHLGFRQFQRLARNGINVREADVARAFRDAMEQVIAIAPDLVVIAGDVFDTPKPPNNAIVLAHRMLHELRSRCPATEVVLVAGNHDAPRIAELGSILAIFEPLGVHLAAGAAKRIRIPRLDLSVLAVPDVAGVRPLIAPDPEARYNVLVLHGEVEYAAADAPHPWDYVALGHYHVHREVAPRARYAGALDYVSSNIWGELAEESACGVPGKGFVLADLAAGAATFHAIPRARGFVDLAPIDATGLLAPDVDALIAERVATAPVPLAGAVARLVVRNIPRAVSAALDKRALRELRGTALHFLLTLERPAEGATVDGARPARGRQSLEAIVREAFAQRADLTAEDREQLSAMAMRYLGAASEQSSEALDTPPADEAKESHEQAA